MNPRALALLALLLLGCPAPAPLDLSVPSSSMNSQLGTKPSDLKPMSIWTLSSSTVNTVP